MTKYMIKRLLRHKLSHVFFILFSVHQRLNDFVLFMCMP